MGISQDIQKALEQGQSVQASGNRIFIAGKKVAVIHRSTLRGMGFSSVSAYVNFERTKFTTQEGNAVSKEQYEKLKAQRDADRRYYAGKGTGAGEEHPRYDTTDPSVRAHLRGDIPKTPFEVTPHKLVGEAAERLSWYREAFGVESKQMFGEGETVPYDVGYRPFSMQVFKPESDVGQKISRKKFVSEELHEAFFTFPEKKEELRPAEKRTESLRTGMTLKSLEAKYGYGVSDLGFLAPQPLISGFGQVTAGLGASAISTVYAVKDPVGTVETTLEFGEKLVTHPFKTSKEVITGLHGHIQEKGLVYVAGEFGGYYLQGRLIGFAGGKAYAKSPVKIKYEKFSLPMAKGSKVLYRGLGVEVKKKGYGVVGLGDEFKLKLGTPDIDFAKADFSKGFISETSIGRSIVEKGVKKIYSAEEVTKFKKGTKIMSATETVPSAFIEKKFIAETKTLKPAGVKKVLEFAKREDAELFGSFSARPQIIKELATDISADIDVKLMLSEAKTMKKSDVLVKELRSIGEKARRIEGKTGIETFGADKKWHHAVDLKSKEAPMEELTSPALAQEGIYGLKFDQKAIKIADIKVMPLSEQGLRKGASIFTLRKEGFAPASHRIKDIRGYFIAQETLIRSMPKYKQAGLLKELEELKGMYPEELFTQPSKPVKTLIYDPKDIKSGEFMPGISLGMLPKFKSPSLAIKSVSKASMRASPSLRASPLSKVSPSPYRASKKSPYLPSSPRKSPSPSPSISPYPSPKPSPSPSPSISPYPSPKPSPSPSPSPYKSPYPSPKPSPSPSPSPYKSPYPSPKPSPSPSPSPSPYPTKTIITTPMRFKSREHRTRFQEFPRTPIRQPKILTPTGRAALFGLRGKTTKAAVKTGLGERYVNIPKAKRKKSVRSRIKL